MHRVAVLALDGVVTLDLAAPLQIFGSAPGLDQSSNLYSVVVVGVRRGRVRTAEGIDIVATEGLRALEDAETVVVPGTMPLAAPSPSTRRALSAAHARGARVASICTGTFVLAAAGLLAGRPATTHWGATAILEAEYPSLDVRRDVLFVDDDDVLTSAGVASGIDLCLHMVRNDFGAQEAARRARWSVVAPHREGGQAQFVEAPMAPRADDLTPTLEWATERVAQPLDVDDLARHALMSRRNFDRRFRARTGTTPKRWLIRQRIAHAQLLLETGDRPVAEVARLSGFASTSSFRARFTQEVTIGPRAYRARFCR